MLSQDAADYIQQQKKSLKSLQLEQKYKESLLWSFIRVKWQVCRTLKISALPVDASFDSSQWSESGFKSLLNTRSDQNASRQEQQLSLVLKDASVADL